MKTPQIAIPPPLPSQTAVSLPITVAPSTADDGTSKAPHSRVPKWPFGAVLACGLVGFALALLFGQQEANRQFSKDWLLNAFLCAVFITVGAAYFTSIVICAFKDKPIFTAIGCVGVVMPAISFWPIVGAIRLAKPHSAWARKYYGPEKMQIAKARFPKSR